jgi:hypothetical protein
MNSLSIRIGIAALTLTVLAGCSSSEMKAEPFPDVPDDMKSGPGLFTGQSGDFDVAAAARGDPQGGASDTSDFEEWKRGRGSDDGDLSSWLGDDTSTSRDSTGSSDVADATLKGLENDPDYQEYLEYKRWKEFRDFQDWKRQQSQ